MPNYKRVYADEHCYFFTLVTHKRNPILIENIDLLREAFQNSKTRYPYKIDAIVILPDHLHMLIRPENATDYPKIVSTIKQHFSRHCDPQYYRHITQSESRIKAGYKPIWQKKYYEHTIRSIDDYSSRFHYIHFNPVKHGYVSQVQDWEHSSFHRYVQKDYYTSEWGDFKSQVDYE